MKKYYEVRAEALDKRLTSYLSKEGLVSIEVASEEQLKSLVIDFVKDFLNHQLTFDDLSSLCEKVFVVLQEKPDRKDSNLFSMCNYGAELNWYIRNEPVRAADFLETILEWYREHLT
jgi:hypothetical protein